jgi:integrase
LHGIHVLRGAVDHAKKLGYKANDIEWPKLKKGKGRLRYLSADEEQSLLRELQPDRPFGTEGRSDPNVWSEDKKRARLDNYHLVIMLLDTGARYGEVAGLKWSQIDLEERAIHLWRSKVENESILYMTDRVYAVMKERSASKDHEEWVFTNKNMSGPRNHSTIAIRKAMKRAGLEGVRVHDLRHTAASKLVQNGLSLQEVSSILGHSTVQMTARYAHLQPTETSKKARDVLNKLNQDNRPELKLVGE